VLWLCGLRGSEMGLRAWWLEMLDEESCSERRSSSCLGHRMGMVWLTNVAVSKLVVQHAFGSHFSSAKVGPRVAGGWPWRRMAVKHQVAIAHHHASVPKYTVLTTSPSKTMPRPRQASGHSRYYLNFGLSSLHAMLALNRFGALLLQSYSGRSYSVHSRLRSTVNQNYIYQDPIEWLLSNDP
jgi:hypothetical protein